MLDACLPTPPQNTAMGEVFTGPPTHPVLLDGAAGLQAEEPAVRQALTPAAVVEAGSPSKPQTPTKIPTIVLL